MELVKFNIKNYRSIKESGDCYLAPDITVLAGKNEAGKSAVLEALEHFNQGKTLPDIAKPIDKSSDDVSHVEVTYRLSKKDKEALLPSLKNDDVLEEGGEITISNNFDNKFEITSDLKDVFPEVVESEQEVIDEIVDLLFGILDDDKYDFSTSFSKEDVENFDANNIDAILEREQDNLRAIREELETEIKEKRQNENSAAEQIEELRDKADHLGSLISSLTKHQEKYNKRKIDRDNLQRNLINESPIFVLFQYSADMIPNEVPLNELDNSQFIADLTKISEFDPSIVRSGTDREKQSHRRKVNIDLNEDYEQFWTQDASNLWVDWDNEKLTFWIRDEGEYYEPSIRSQGRRWHLSFYIRLTAHAEEENPPVVLIDDLGIHLHEEAQKDILAHLEEISNECRVIFTTHSSKLIDPNHLNRVRLVENLKNGTEINKIHADADKETLSPILSAIGAAPELGVRTDARNSIVVEGISDYYYLQAIRQIIDFDEDLYIIPGVGDTTQLYIGAILFGWGVDPIFILDGDDAHNIRNKLEERLQIEDDKMIYVHDEGSVEDVFSKSDFVEHVMDDPELDFESDLNSEYMNRASQSKALTSKLFYEKIEENEGELDFDSETIENIERIFDDLDTAMSG